VSHDVVSEVTETFSSFDLSSAAMVEKLTRRTARDYSHSCIEGFRRIRKTRLEGCAKTVCKWAGFDLLPR
jgi:hypothetical protein